MKRGEIIFERKKMLCECIYILKKGREKKKFLGGQKKRRTERSKI